MPGLPIPDSMEEHLIYIGMGKSLKTRLEQIIKDVDLATPSDIDSKSKRHPAATERVAVKMGCRLEVSWAETVSHDSAKAHKAALIHEYVKQHSSLPWIESPEGRVLGNHQTPKLRQEPVSDLDWSDWTEMRESNIARIPENPGVYRVRALCP